MSDVSSPAVVAPVAPAPAGVAAANASPPAPAADAEKAKQVPAQASDAKSGDAQEAPEGPKVDIPAGRLAALDRKAAAIRAEKAALAAKQAEIDAKAAQLKDRETFAAEFKSNPLKAMMDAGMTREQADAALLDWFQSQKPRTADEELAARDAKIAAFEKAEAERKAAEKKAADERAKSEATAKTYAQGKSFIEAAPPEQSDIVRGLMKAGEVVRTSLQPEGVSVEKLIVDAAAQEWLENGRPQLTEKQYAKLIAKVTAEANEALAKKPELVERFRPKTTVVVESTPKSPAEIGRGERVPNLKRPTTREELNARLKEFNRS